MQLQAEHLCELSCCLHFLHCQTLLEALYLYFLFPWLKLSPGAGCTEQGRPTAHGPRPTTPSHLSWDLGWDFLAGELAASSTDCPCVQNLPKRQFAPSECPGWPRSRNEIPWRIPSLPGSCLGVLLAKPGGWKSLLKAILSSVTRSAPHPSLRVLGSWQLH